MNGQKTEVSFEQTSGPDAQHSENPHVLFILHETPPT
jgi:hypothetical protein